MSDITLFGYFSLAGSLFVSLRFLATLERFLNHPNETTHQDPHRVQTKGKSRADWAFSVRYPRLWDILFWGFLYKNCKHGIPRIPLLSIVNVASLYSHYYIQLNWSFSHQNMVKSTRCFPLHPYWQMTDFISDKLDCLEEKRNTFCINKMWTTG